MEFIKTADRSEMVRFAASAVLAFAVLTASSHIALPIGPVPMTMQTLAVTLVGVWLGAKAGALVVALWVAAGFSGLPIFAMGNGGLAALMGPTAGFLYSFPLVAAVAAWLAGRGGVIRVFAAMLAANLLCLVIGTAWLALSMDPMRAIAVGTTPFVPGAFLKSCLGALLVKAARMHSEK
ncbi:MAG: biotin transporter BioY [Duodenibacillus sp.]|nr:biotin transporter BioY [Duodenibacillus sp.]